MMQLWNVKHARKRVECGGGGKGEGSGEATEGEAGRDATRCASVLGCCAHSFGTCAENTQLSKCNPEERKEKKKDPRKVLEDLVRADADNNSHLVNVTQPTHGEKQTPNFLAVL